MTIHPRYRRYLRQTFAFGMIWLSFGLVYALFEVGLLGRLTEYPGTGNKYDFQISLITICIGSFLTGLLQGWIEVTWLGRILSQYSLRKKIVLKSVFYLTFLTLFLIYLTRHLTK